MRILLTGGAGFIGSHLAGQLLKDGHTVFCLDNFNDFYNPQIKRQNIQDLQNDEPFHLVEGDILDWELLNNLCARQQFDDIIHLAARAGVRPSIKQPLLYQDVNCRGTQNLLEMAKEFCIKKFIFASSSSVYGENKKIPFSESDSVDCPVSPYAATKKAGELICYTYHHLYGIPVTCLRFFTVYGPRQRPDMAIHKFTKLIDAGKKVPMYGDGKSKRDYTYIDDIINGVMAAYENCKGYRIYNLGESQTVELRKMIGLLEEHIGKKADIETMPVQPGDVPVTHADITRAKSELNYSPQVPIEEGVRLFVGWYKSNNYADGI